MLRPYRRTLWPQIIYLKGKSSIARIPFIFSERGTSKKQFRQTSSNPFISYHSLQKKQNESIAMFCTSNIVYFIRQRSAFQFLGVCYFMGGIVLTIHCLNPILTYFIFNGKETQPKSGEEWGTMLHSKRCPTQLSGVTCLLNRKVSGAICATASL